MRHPPAARIVLSLAILIPSLLAACGGAGGSSDPGGGDWYYHFSCNGDSQCLSTNPTGQPSGNLDEGPAEASCTELMAFAAGPGGWGPAAFNACDQSSAFPLHLLSLTVSPSDSSLPLGASRQFQAIAHYNDGSYRDVTAQATWTIPSGGGFASITAGGLVTGVAQGTATVAATMGVVSGNTTVTVGPVAIVTLTVGPADPTIAMGQQQAFTATGHYSDGSAKDVTATAYWSSSPGAVATIAPGGLASGVQAGTATITADSGGVSGSTTLTVTGAVLVSIAVEPTGPTVARTFSRALGAVGTFSDGTARDVTAQVSWTSATQAVATVDGSGLVTGVAAGTSLVTATMGAISGQVTLTVTAATLQSITVTPALPSVAPAATVGFAATGHFSDGTSQPLAAGITWSSATPAVATIAATGVATAVAVGTTVVSATVGAISGSVTLNVTLTPPGVDWTFQPFSPVGTLTSVVWSGTQFVAVGGQGHLLTSPDGLTWTPGSSGVTGSYLLGVAWSGPLGRYVAVGDPDIFTSSDGVTWTPNSSGIIPTSLLYGVMWSGTQFVAVGVSWPPGTGVVLTSPDGLAWTAQDSATTATLRSVAWSGVQYVATGDATVVSADAKKWTKAATETVPWTSLAWSGSVFVRVSSLGDVQTSADGITWVAQATQPMGLYCVIWADTQFVAVGGGGYTGYIATSPDGITWTASTIGTAGTPTGSAYQFDGVAWSGTRLVAVGFAGPGAEVSP